MKIVDFSRASGERAAETNETESGYNFFSTGIACFYVRFYDAKDEEEFKYIVNAFSTKTEIEVSKIDGTYKVEDKTVPDLKSRESIESAWAIMMRKYLSLSKITRNDDLEDVKYFPIRFDDKAIPVCSRLEFAG